jgi:metal-responsive CopG/Arc/MetJ family transcriptional regulator
MSHKYNVIPIAVRRSITWRIPIDLIDAVDEMRKHDKRDRTAVVVEAIQRLVQSNARKRPGRFMRAPRRNR